MFYDKDCKIETNLSKLNRTNGWVWKGLWIVEVNEETDDGGWKYAKTTAGEYRRRNSLLDIVRVRKWKREAFKISQ